MDVSLKEVISKHWATLVRYMNPTQSLLDVFVEEKVLPSAMINDVQKGNTRRDKNEILLKFIKLRGNTSYRNLRDAMVKSGQIFLADLLFEEDGNMCLIEDSDFAAFPEFKLSLSPTTIRHVVLALDAKIRARVLKREWKNDSNRRSELVQKRIEEEKAYVSSQEKDEKIKQITAELNVKNDIIRSLSLDFNILNAEVETFTQKHSSCAQNKRLEIPTLSIHKSPPLNETSNNFGFDDQQKRPSSQTGQSLAPVVLVCARNKIVSKSTDGPPESLTRSGRTQPSRFTCIDQALKEVNSTLLSILGIPIDQRDDEPSIDIIRERIVQIQKHVTKLEENLIESLKDKEEAIAMLLPDTQQKFTTAVLGVQRYLVNEQRTKFSLLKDIDRLSKKLRGMNTPLPNSGLYALRQSAVTAKPTVELLDYRFLSNHICLLEADADHLRRKLQWKEDDIRELLDEMTRLKGSLGGKSVSATILSPKQALQ